MRKIFLDCGANRGQSINAFLKEFPNSNEFEIFSFEPGRSEEILSSLYKFKSEKIKIFNSAVDTQDGYKKFYDSGDTSSSLIDRNRTKNTIKVKTICLSKFILENFDEKDYIILKIDIEGSEYDVIDDLFKKSIFKYINVFFAEIHGSKIGKSLDDSIDLLNKVNSSGHKIYEWEAKDFKYDNFKKNYYTIEKIKLYHAKWDKKFPKKNILYKIKRLYWRIKNYYLD